MSPINAVNIHIITVIPSYDGILLLFSYNSVNDKLFVINFVYNNNSLADPGGGLANGQPVRAGDPSSFYGGILA